MKRRHEQQFVVTRHGGGDNVHERREYKHTCDNKHGCGNAIPQLFPQNEKKV
jgi:hypothetical protein